MRACAFVEIGDEQGVDVFLRKEDAFHALEDAINDEPDCAGALFAAPIERRIEAVNELAHRGSCGGGSALRAGVRRNLAQYCFFADLRKETSLARGDTLCFARRFIVCACRGCPRQRRCCPHFGLVQLRHAAADSTEDRADGKRGEQREGEERADPREDPNPWAHCLLFDVATT